MNYENLNIPVAQQKKLKEFIEIEIPKIPYFKPDGKPNKKWKLFKAKTRDAALDAARDAALDAALGAARDAALDAARGAALDAAWDAAWDAARDAAWDAALDAARGAAWDAARGAAWGAALDAARDAAWDAALDAARDAALDARFIIIEDLEFPNKKQHQKYVKDLMQIWQKGYGCICDVNGVFYVYAKED